MKFKILPPGKLIEITRKKVAAWKKETDALVRKGVPAHSELGLVLRNKKAREALPEQEKKRLDTELAKALNEERVDSGKVKRLLDAGADPNSLESGMSSLMIAASCGFGPENVELLISYGADPDLQDADGNTALIHASKTNNKETAEALLKNGADPYIKNKEGKDAMDEAPWVTDGVAHVLAKYGVPLPPEYIDDIPGDEPQDEVDMEGFPFHTDDDDAPF
jgi:hypothetical protein